MRRRTGDPYRRRRGDLGGLADFRSLDALILLVPGPVDLPAAGVGDDEQVPAVGVGVGTSRVGGDRVERAHPVHRNAERIAERGGCHHSHPQAGERTGAHTDDDRIEFCRRVPGLGEALENLGSEVLRVCAGILGHARRQGFRPDSVTTETDESGGHGRGGGIDSEHEHDVPAYAPCGVVIPPRSTPRGGHHSRDRDANAPADAGR